MMSMALWVLVGLLAGPADEWCGGKTGKEAKQCARVCDAYPVSEACHLFVRFGSPGLIAGAVAKERGLPVSQVASEYGFSVDDSAILAVLFDAIEFAPLPLSDAQEVRVAQGDAAVAEAQRARAAGNYQTGAEAYMRAVTAYDSTLGSMHPKTVGARAMGAGVLMLAGRYRDAERLMDRAAPDAERLFGSEHPQFAIALNNLADLYERMGAYEKAKPLYLRSLDIKKKALGPDHPDVAVTLDNLAGLYGRKGAYEKAEPLYLRALAIFEMAWGSNHPDVATTLNNLAGLYGRTGAYEKAEPLYLRVLAINRKALGPDHPDVATTLNNLAGLYIQTGAYEKAEPLYLRALAVNQKALGPEHPYVAAGLNNLAGLYVHMGLYEQAEPLHLGSLLIAEKILGPNHPKVATNLSNLAGLYERMGAYEKAEPLYLRSLDITEKALGPDHPEVAVTLHNLGFLKNSQREHLAALPYLERAARIHERLPAQHPDLVRTAETLGLTLLRLGRTDDARRWLAVAERIDLTHFQAVVEMVQTDAELLALHSQRLPSFTQAVGLYDAEAGFDAALRWQGAALAAEMRWRDLRRIEQRDAANAAAEAPSGRSRVQRFREAIAARLRWLRTASTTPEEEARRAAGLEKAEADVQALSAALAAAHPDFGAHRALLDVGPADVCRALHARGGAPLVDYVSHRVIDRTAEGIEFIPHLLAFVVVPGPDGACTTQRVELGPADTLDAAYGAWRGAIDAAEACYAKAGRPHPCAAKFADLDAAAARVHAMAWAPVARSVDGRPEIFVVPDGPLASVPFGALPTADGYLAERHALTVLSFPAAVTLLDRPSPSAESGGGALVVGDVNYQLGNRLERARRNLRRCRSDGCDDFDASDKAAFDVAHEKREDERVAIAARDLLAGGPPDGPCGPDIGTWAALKSGRDPKRPRSTRLEGLAADLHGMLGAETTLVTDKSATEPVVTALMRGSRIIHLQTHGYAISDAMCAMRHAVVKVRRKDDGASMHDRPTARYVFDPHRLAGLIFAGRNPIAEAQKKSLDADITWRPDDEVRARDGLFRARDALNLDLEGTLLVVLAACQSGLGMRVTGEGALGLGRAFLVAGARYAVVSQWQVPFKASSGLFTGNQVSAPERGDKRTALGFYRRVADGVPPPLALQQAQKEAIAAWEAKGVTHSAFMWGAFVPLVGR